MNRNTIKDLSIQDRPREKMLEKGRHALSDSELIAILLGSGNREESAVQLAQRILSDVDHDLDKFSKLSISDLSRYKGVGKAKAITVAAALELGRRRKEMSQDEVVQINSSKLAYDLFKSVFMDLPHEEFWIITLNRRNQLIKKHLIGRGGVSGTVADVKLIMKNAIQDLASGIILAHNHPSGNMSPSNADIKLTKRIKEASTVMDLGLLDHLIISDFEYLSFADENLL